VVRRPSEDEIMTRRDPVPGPLPRAPWAPGSPPLRGGFGATLRDGVAGYAAFAAVLLVLAGCVTTGQHRGKSADETELQRYDIPTVGERTAVGNAEPTAIGGVGLVTGLEGTGGDCAHDDYRRLLADGLRKEGVQQVSQLLTSPDCALVIVDGLFPVGASKGDRIDVEVKLPPGSKATSLRGGVLHKCFLKDYALARQLKPDYKGPANMFEGHTLVVAEGPILVGSGDGEEAGRVKQGRIWQGGRCLADHPLALVMNADSQQARFTSLITDRINGTFQAGLRGSLDNRLAYTRDNLSISLRVPAAYRNNLPRYLRVIRVVPLGDAADLIPRQGDDRRSYRQKLGDDLLDPARTVVAALRLEALGQKSVPVLKEGLKSQHALVRFASAESLAYLSSAAGCTVLHRAVVEQPMLRSFALTALASLDEAGSLIALKELVSGDLDDEARVGAFRALHLLNERDPMVQGEYLGQSFWLHRVAPGTRPLIHVSTAKRAEVVLFGESPSLRPPFSILAGEFTVTATEESPAATITRVPLQGKPARQTCSLALEDVLRAMADLGAQYPEVLTLIQQAGTYDRLTCRVRVDALPQAASVYDVAKLGKDGEPEKTAR
jgi:hypothetical protein